MTEDLSKLDLVELLALLEPIPEPNAVSMWPQTAGWVWLGMGMLALAAWLGHRWIRHRRANAYRRAALREIAAVGANPAALAAILRRTSLAAFPRTDVASLHGEDWLAFLDRTYGGSAFRQGAGRILARAPYTSVTPSDDVGSLAAQWVRRHRPPRARAS